MDHEGVVVGRVRLKVAKWIVWGQLFGRLDFALCLSWDSSGAQRSDASRDEPGGESVGDGIYAWSSPTRRLPGGGSLLDQRRGAVVVRLMRIGLAVRALAVLRFAECGCGWR